jgi:hypothetical protein
MIKIVKSGKKEFYCICGRCGCEFTYEHEDITLSSFVICPDCGEHCYIGGSRPSAPKIGWPMPGEPIPCNTPLAPANADPCAGCDWLEKMSKPGAVYIGDTPCTWCNKNKFYCGSNTALSTKASTQVNGSVQAIADLASYSGTPNTCAFDTVSSSLRKCNCKE